MSDCPLPLLLRPDGKPFTLQSYLARMASEPVERVVMHVMRAAQQGDLPLYAWTLALPQHRLLVLLRALYPELPVLQGLPVAAYRRLVARVPPWWIICWPMRTLMGITCARKPWRAPWPWPAWERQNSGKMQACPARRRCSSC